MSLSASHWHWQLGHSALSVPVSISIRISCSNLIKALLPCSPADQNVSSCIIGLSTVTGWSLIILNADSLLTLSPTESCNGSPLWLVHMLSQLQSLQVCNCLDTTCEHSWSQLKGDWMCECRQFPRSQIQPGIVRS